MNHWSARRHLASIPDRVLPPRLEERVLAHTRACPSCRQRLDEYFATDRLLQRIPASLLAVAGGSAVESRLAGLRRWAPAPSAPPVGRWRAPVLGAVALIVAVMLQLSIVLPPAPSRAPRGERGGERWVVVASVPNDTQLGGAMGGWR